VLLFPWLCSSSSCWPSQAGRGAGKVAQEATPPRLLVVSNDPAHLLPLNESAGLLSALLLTGELPAERTRAVVLTDLNCQADAAGISHCTNDLQIGEQQLSVQHDHTMRSVPCLTPGEEVDVISLALYEAAQGKD
jgi:hypothetical protein